MPPLPCQWQHSFNVSPSPAAMREIGLKNDSNLHQVKAYLTIQVGFSLRRESKYRAVYEQDDEMATFRQSSSHTRSSADWPADYYKGIQVETMARACEVPPPQVRYNCSKG